MTATAGPALYSDVIRERWRRPRFRGTLADATSTAEDVNPLCGDRVRLMVRVAGDRVDAVRFTGDACAICLAAADLLAEMTEGKTVATARALGPRDVLAALHADIRPARLRCATLPLSVLQAALS